MKMTDIFDFILFLALTSISKCYVNSVKIREPHLQITAMIGDTLFPVVKDYIEQDVGTNFKLICDLLSSDINKFDDQISWFKKELGPKQTNVKRDTTFSKTLMNKSVKNFDSVKVEDRGNYSCVSMKFNLIKNVEIRVRNQKTHQIPEPNFEVRVTTYCNEQMFQCESTGICVFSHYVCDGKADCKDESDESIENCHGDPCKDKIRCEDGRCIPTAWCCDRDHDENCNVTHRPACCLQIFSESYEELEYNFPNVHQAPHNGARYLFISVCIVSIVFSIVLLLLIVSRVVVFAKKTALQPQRHTLCENIALRRQTTVNLIPCDVYNYRGSSARGIAPDSTDASDPLLYNPARFNLGVADQPPSYVDALRSNIVDPPPPYTSREVLNDDRSDRCA